MGVGTTDILGPLPRARLGARHILVCIDNFTRWVKLTSFEGVQEEEVVEFLRDRWITQHGILLSDKRRQFIAEVVGE